MIRSILVSALLAAFAAVVGSVPASADAGPAISGKPDAAEASFVRVMQADLTKRYPHPAEAIRDGFVRYTNEDDTGAISYANRHWTSSDVHHPSQLWFDAHGALLGADYSLPKTPQQPKRWGLQPGRWASFDAHIHYVTVDHATGAKRYDLYVMPGPFAAAGGNVQNPQAATLVKLGKVKTASDVATVFLFPSIWDVSIWVKDNPNGAFADKNPLVTPASH